MNAGAFSFDAATHIYRLGSRIIPGHTRVLDLGGLVPYAAIDPDILERKSELGREAHLACRWHDEGKNFTYDEKIRGYLMAWIAFRKDSGFVPKLIETQGLYCFNGLYFGMQIDRLGRFSNDARRKERECAVEIKTTSQPLPHHGVQLAAQAAGLEHPEVRSHTARFLVRDRIAVYLKPNGAYRIERYTDGGDLAMFEHALATTYWKKQFEKIYKEISAGGNSDGNATAANANF